MPKNSCIMQIWAESGKSALPICNYSQILYQFLTFTQNLKRSHSFQLPSNQCGAYSQQRCKHQYYCAVDCILQILFSSYPISLSFNQSVVAKIKKHFNQFTMSLLFCVILFYRFFLPLYLPLSEFVNTDGTI